MKNTEEILLELVAGQARIENKIDTITVNQKDHERNDVHRFEEQSTRIRSLEHSRIWVYGAAATIALAVTTFGDKVIAKVFSQ